MESQQQLFNKFGGLISKKSITRDGDEAYAMRSKFGVIEIVDGAINCFFRVGFPGYSNGTYFQLTIIY